jgi:hypothetical protein
MRHHWQLSATYSYSGTWVLDVLPLLPGCKYPVSGAGGKCDVPITLAEDISTGDYYLSGAQRHRAVVNGIWQLPYDIQLSGLYFFGDNGSGTSTAGVDVRQSLLTPNLSNPQRLRPDGSVIARNNMRRDPIHRVDMRVQRRFRIGPRMTADGIFEVFNLFNHANYNAYVTNESSSSFGQPVQDTNLAYAPRMLQLGFRFAF